MSGKMLLYPFNAENAPIARYAPMAGYEMGAAVAPESWGYHGKDVSFCDGGPDTGLLVTDDFEGALPHCDAVFMSYESEWISRKTYSENIRKCLDSGKELIVTYRLKQYLEDTGSDFRQIKVIGQNAAPEIGSDNLGLLPINIPVILVAGIGENCDKFSVQLALREFFSPKCGSILQLGTKEYSELFGFMPLPDFLFRPGDFSRKILSLNHYIYREIKKTHPDLLILGIPGGISYMTMKEPRKFGELALCVSNAINPDMCVLSVYAGEYTPEQIENIRTKIECKLDCPIDHIHVANHRILFDPDGLEGQISFLTDHWQRIKPSEMMFSVHDKIKSDAVFSSIYQSLTEAENII